MSLISTLELVRTTGPEPLPVRKRALNDCVPSVSRSALIEILKLALPSLPIVTEPDVVPVKSLLVVVTSSIS